MENNHRSIIAEITQNPELLQEEHYQSVIVDLMSQLDNGSISLVMFREGKPFIESLIIDLLSHSIALRKYVLNALPLEKHHESFPGVRQLPHSFVRFGATVKEGAVLMPFSLVNMGAYVGERTMIDGGARIGSGAYVGADVHISGGVGLGGVLEPKQERPVIIEDHCFIGANSSISEGVHIGSGTIVGAGTIITASTRIYDSRKGEAVQIQKGVLPPGVVAVSSSYKADSGLYRPCVEIIRDVEKDRKQIINELLR